MLDLTPQPDSKLKKLYFSYEVKAGDEWRPKLRALIDSGWRNTYSTLFDTVERPFVDVLGEHHAEAIEWHWNARLALLNGEEPDYWTYFPIWSRGHMKSTVARRIVVIDALMSIAYDQPSYILYVSRNKKMAEKHAKSIETILTDSRIVAICPGIAEVQKNAQGNSKGWTGEFINTSVGAIFHFAGLDEGLAGGNVDDVRPTFIVPDDIDGRESSPTEGENRFQKLTTEVLPMRQANTLQFWAQNLISRYSAMYRIQSGRERVLTNRKPTLPIKAIEGLETEELTVDGIVRDVIIAGTPTWKFYNIKRCQEEINTIGLEAFKRECQHEVEQSNEGLRAYNFRDDVHVISESEFAAVYGTRSIPRDWAKWAINDWANTKTEKHANVAGWMTVSNQNSLLPGMTFLFYPMSFKANAEAEDVAERIITQLTPFVYRRTTWAQVRKDALLRSNSTLHTNGLQDRIEFERGILTKVLKKPAKEIFKKWNVRGGVMGHSDTTITNVYKEVYGLNLQPINPGNWGGLEDLNRAMKSDMKEPHPFKKNAFGYTRWFVVVPDADDGSGKPRPYPTALKPNDLHDSDLFRYQMRNWRLREPKLTETGEIIDEPLKMNDDFGQALMMFYFSKLIFSVPLTPGEKVVEAIPRATRELTKKKVLSPGEQLALDEEMQEAQKKVRKNYDPRRNSLGTEEASDFPIRPNSPSRKPAPKSEIISPLKCDYGFDESF